MNTNVTANIASNATNLNERFGPNEETQLIQACKYYDVEKALDLIKAGADVTLAAKNGITALHWISILGIKTLLQPILEKIPTEEIKINLFDKAIGVKQMTPLMLAVFRGHIEFAKLLITKGSSDYKARLGFNSLENQNLIDSESCKISLENLDLARFELNQGMPLKVSEILKIQAQYFTPPQTQAQNIVSMLTHDIAACVENSPIQLVNDPSKEIKWKKYLFECIPYIISVAGSKQKLPQALLKLIHQFRATAILNSLHAINDTVAHLEKAFEKLAKSWKFQVKQGVDVISTPFRIAFIIPEGGKQPIIEELLKAVERCKNYSPDVKDKLWSENDEFFRINALPVKDEYDFLDADVIAVTVPQEFDATYLKPIFNTITVDARSWTPLIAFLSPDQSGSTSSNEFREKCVASSFGCDMKFIPGVHPSFRRRYYKNMMENSIFINEKAPLSTYSNRIDQFLDGCQSNFSKSRLEPILMVLNELEFILVKSNDLNAKDPFLEIVKKHLVMPNLWENSIAKTFASVSNPLNIDDASVLNAVVKMSQETVDWAIRASNNILKEINESEFFRLSSLVELNLLRFLENMKEFLEYESISRFRDASNKLIIQLHQSNGRIELITNSDIDKDFRENVKVIIDRFTLRLTQLFECALDVRNRKDLTDETIRNLLDDIRNAKAKLIERSVVSPDNLHLPKELSNNNA